MTRAVTAPRAFDLGREHGWEPLRVEGALPADLRGTLYRNGPRRFSDTNAAHWFDGVGGVAAVRLGGGRAEGAVRLVSTPEVDADRRGRPRYGAFAAKAAWDKRLAVLFGRRGFKNLANINVLAWQGRLFALYEALNPLELHPETLASLGESTLGGALRNGFQAHPHRVPERRATYALGMNIGPGPRCTLDLVELPDQGPARRLTTLPLDGVREVHDFAVTERHAVIVVPPLSAPAWKVALHGTFAATVTWDEAAGCEVIVVPLDAPARARRFKTDAFFAWHWANGWELGDGRIGLDVVRYEPWTGPWLPPESVVSGGFPPLAAPPGTRPTLWRATVDPARERFELGPLWEAARCEFPSVAPSQVGARHAATWLASASADGGPTRDWFDRIARVDAETGEATLFDPGAGRFVGEPVLVERAGGGVWALVMVDEPAARRTHLAIWDGERPGEPVARCFFDQRLPPDLHGTFVAAA